MSEEDFRWRETYFVYFDSHRRPKLDEVRAMVAGLRGHFQVAAGEADDTGRIESLTIHSPQDYAALEIDYLAGDEVRADGQALASDLGKDKDVDRTKLAKLTKSNARFDLMHFEAVPDDDPDDPDEMFDPSALLTVFEALRHLTEGIGVDPQAGILY